MIKYKLTRRGKLVVAMLCSFIVLFVSLGGSFYKSDDLKNNDYSKPSSDEQQQATIPEPPLIKVEEEDLWKKLQVAVFFEANMTSLDNQYYKALNVFSDTALQHEDIKIQVEGNCATLFPSNPRQKSINYNLSLLRAQAIADYMKNKGISADRLIIVANGSDKPLNNNSSPEERKFNRRVDVFFVNR